MIFADADFYKNEYLLGRTEIIPLEEFLFWSRKASNRINRKRIILDEIPEYLKNCTCSIAEIYYMDEQNRKTGAKSSESVGAYSVSYVDQRQEDPVIAAEINSTIIDWLSGTALHNDFVFKGR